MGTRAYYEQMIANSTPGRFEGEQPWTAYYWEMSLDGFGGEQVEEDGDLYIKFDVDAEDVTLFPELEGATEVRLYQSEQGFVSTTVVRSAI